MLFPVTRLTGGLTANVLTTVTRLTGGGGVTANVLPPVTRLTGG